MFATMTDTPNDLAPQTGLTPDQIAARVDTIIASATLEEKVGMMSGKGFFKQFAESGRLWGAEPYRAGSMCLRFILQTGHAAWREASRHAFL
jgi:beta-glucosidase